MAEVGCTSVGPVCTVVGHCCKLEARKLGIRGAAGPERISWEQLLSMMWLCKSQGTFNGIAQAFMRLPST